MEKAGARGVSGQGGSAPHPWGLSLQDTASTASELVLPPRGRHLLFFNLLQFHSHLPGPFQVLQCLVKQMPWPVSSLLPPPLSQPLFLLPWAPLKLSTPPTEVPFFFLISFLLKARLSYHQNHSQMTGFDGLTRHVSNYLLGDKSETTWLKWKCTFAQVRGSPDWMRPCIYGPVCPATHAVCSQEPRPSPICPLALGPSERPYTHQAGSKCSQRWLA